EESKLKRPRKHLRSTPNNIQQDLLLSKRIRHLGRLFSTCLNRRTIQTILLIQVDPRWRPTTQQVGHLPIKWALNLIGFKMISQAPLKRSRTEKFKNRNN